MEEQIHARIETLKKEREAYVLQANQQVIAYNAVIAELENLIASKEVVADTAIPNS